MLFHDAWFVQHLSFILWPTREWMESLALLSNTRKSCSNSNNEYSQNQFRIRGWQSWNRENKQTNKTTDMDLLGCVSQGAVVCLAAAVQCFQSNDCNALRVIVPCKFIWRIKMTIVTLSNFHDRLLLRNGISDIWGIILSGGWQMSKVDGK